MNKEEMSKIVDRYAVVNAAKSAATKEVAELGKAIKAYFTEREIAIFNTDENTAIVSYRKSRTLDADKLAAHFGGKIPDKFYTEKETPTLTIKTRKPAQAVINAISAA